MLVTHWCVPVLVVLDKSWLFFVAKIQVAEEQHPELQALLGEKWQVLEGSGHARSRLPINLFILMICVLQWFRISKSTGESWSSQKYTYIHGYVLFFRWFTWKQTLKRDCDWTLCENRFFQSCVSYCFPFVAERVSHNSKLLNRKVLVQNDTAQCKETRDKVVLKHLHTPPLRRGDTNKNNSDLSNIMRWPR